MRVPADIFQDSTALEQLAVRDKEALRIVCSKLRRHF